MPLFDAPSAATAPFTLHLEGIPEAACSVHRWQYRAALDEPYELTAVLHVPREFAGLFGAPLSARLQSPDGLPARFSLQSQPYTWEPLHGRIAHIAWGADELSAPGEARTAPSADLIPCTLTLRPRLWWAGLNQHSRSLQRTSVKDAVTQVLAASLGLSAADIDWRLSTPPPRRRYRQQYQESDLAFVSRLLEREGWSYHFEQTPEREVMIVTDDATGYTRPPQWSGLRYLADTGLKSPTEAGWDQVITRFERRFSVTTTDHQIDDLNYRTAQVNLQAAPTSSSPTPDTPPLGQVHSYGSHSKTPDEAQRHAQQQRERWAQHAVRAFAHSNLTALAPGSCIGIAEGPRRALGRWLILSVQAQGDRQTPYANQFHAQPEATPYRPKWDTPPPDMAGFTHMRLDTTNADNPYARLDPHGRYLAWHYFEHQRSQNGLGSAPIRLARDYAGPTYGQHFPVHAGVEALTSYVHGDPDRPVIVGVAHDSRNPNPVTSANASRHVLRTWANNKLRLEDQGGQEHIKLSTEYGLSQLNLGYLVNQEKKPRGAGFELRTDHEGALRAEQGWLLSTHATDARADPKQEGAQMHSEPLQEHVKGIRPWADNRSKAATQVGLEAASSLQQADKLQDQLKGHSAPLQAWASPAGIVLTARKDTTLGAEQTQGFYSQGAINLTSSEPLGLTAKKGLRLHAEAGGLKQIVSDGDYTIHVQDGDLEILAKEDIQLESKTGVVRLQTKGGKYFVEIGPNGIRTNAKETHMVAGAKVDITGGPVAGQAAASAGKAAGLGYFGKMAVKDTQLGQFKSRYALDQLHAYAQEVDGMLFVMSMAACFGYDIDPSAYLALHEQAKSGALKNPEHDIVHGDGVQWNPSTHVIEVGQRLAQRAAAGDEAAQWQLLGDLIQAFGRYLDDLLRTTLSSTGGQASATDESIYSLLLPDLEAQDHTDYGELIGEGGGPLRAPHAKLKAAMQKAQARSEQLGMERTRALAQARYHDGVYRPERDGKAFLLPVYDADLQDGPLPKGMFSHGRIESGALSKAEPAYKPSEIAMIYYGNWLRDLSQLLDIGIMTAPGQTPKSWTAGVVNSSGYFSRETLSVALIALGEMRFTQRFVDAKVPAQYLDFIQLKAGHEAEYMHRVGTYRPEEHIDNPAGLPKAYPYALPKGWLVPVPIPAAVLGVNPKSHLRSYIDTAADAEHPCAVDYLCGQLAQAAALGKTPAGLMHFGNALHVLEDFFAHTNFVELTLYKLGYRDVITWVPKKPRFEDMPVTTGVF